ncbi:hypothetical protein SDC9_90741 [bioreactor metagenome]|uniref:Uncharacterized protein n=1 Tax=bioreactor metagenome TaxID=1076179 RepID=A0A644ZZM1_9ZZZZ
MPILDRDTIRLPRSRIKRYGPVVLSVPVRLRSPVVNQHVIINREPQTVVGPRLEGVSARAGEGDLPGRSQSVPIDARNAGVGRDRQGRALIVEPGVRRVGVRRSGRAGVAESIQDRRAGHGHGGALEVIPACRETVDVLVVAGRGVRHIGCLCRHRPAVGTEPARRRGPVAIGRPVLTVIDRRAGETRRIGFRQLQILHRIPLGGIRLTGEIGLAGRAEQ